ncbi:IQ domain-containing protein C [Austrofundulus limnaeus]|uniref:IQ domain-containing protein C n=1 Tax=Austrofundulus limnaeus TaxID=52670 RepID=A0A2I4BSH9_AUSLI|nr:PREDICTED: IQ domain-containing protein C [Austrofundulus limnaeus]
MDRSKWENIITNFQARARGYLERNELRRAREDFEEVVMEIDGGLTHLQWTGTAVSFPLFTDTDGPLLPTVSSSLKPSEPDPAACAPLTSAPSSEEASHHCALQEWEEAERDDSQTCLPSSPVRGDEEGQKLSSAVRSIVEPDMNVYSHSGPRRQYCLAQDVPRTPEDLRLHRNTLTMELVWLQQAIDSRKKYLTLRNRLSVS